MCGITGIIHYDKSRKVNKNQLKRMTDIIRHRGPDSDGFYLNGNIGLGHRRLSIIDLSTGDQPMFNNDKSISIVFNGEIYNYVELRDELISLGHNFKTTSDTEVVIKSYEQWGVDCQNKFNGMWAFALWDERKKHLFLSRDRIGEKPLFYSIWDNSLIFGSEIKTIFEYGLPKRPRMELLEIYLVFKSIPAPETFFKDIKKLMPGHYIIAGSNGIRENKYWDLPDIDENNMLNDEHKIYEEFEYLFTDSIRIRMRSDVPFGAFLSGGLDSSSIVALMSEVADYPVKTFTIGYSEKDYDESVLAKLVADKFKTDHSLGTVDIEDFETTLDRISFHYDEPFGDSSAIPTGYVSKFASEKVKMVLTGDGGDEILSGYSSYQGIKFSQKYQQFPSIIKNALPKLVKTTSNLFSGNIRYKLNRLESVLNTANLNFDERILQKRSKPSLSIIKTLLSRNLNVIPIEDFLSPMMTNCPYKDEFYKQMYLNFKFDLPNDYLVKVDRMSMAYSLETRLPFLDHRLIEFMIGVDKKVKMQGWERKSILKNTIGKKLPSQLLHASKKGFRVPVREWFKRDELISKLNQIGKNNEIYNNNAFNKLVVANAAGLEDYGNLLWSITVLNKILTN